MRRVHVLHVLIISVMLCNPLLCTWNGITFRLFHVFQGFDREVKSLLTIIWKTAMFCELKMLFAWMRILFVIFGATSEKRSGLLLLLVSCLPEHMYILLSQLFNRTFFSIDSFQIDVLINDILLFRPHKLLPFPLIFIFFAFIRVAIVFKLLSVFVFHFK